MESILPSEDHGGIDYAELDRLGIQAKDVVDFSVNSNPFGPSPEVREAIQQVDVSQYPDRECAALRSILAKKNQVFPRQILVGNGAAELIWLITSAMLRPMQKVLIVGPTFGEYRRATLARGAQVEEIRAQAPDFAVPLDQICERIIKFEPRLVFLCNPNNPTGAFLSSAELQKILEACQGQTLLVLDEAYRAFVTGDFFAGLPGENCLVLRSMTKDFALAGLRLGYLISASTIIDEVRRVQPAWSVNALAQAAGIAALADLVYYRRSLWDLALLRDHFFSQLRDGGLKLVDSRAHYGLISLGQPAREFRAALLHEGLQVRDCASFGLAEYIRVATRLPADNQKLLAALDKTRVF